MEGPIRQAEAVPVPLARRNRALALVALSVAMLFTGFGATARRADADATPARDMIALQALRLPPKTAERALVTKDAAGGDDDDAGAGDSPVRIPAALLLRLKVARASGDLALFEDIAHEIALRLVR